MKHNVIKIPLLLCVIIAMTPGVSSAQQPTWENGIACIIYSRCSPCHYDNGIAPFPLMSYQDAVANIYGIRDVINTGAMPPYPPDRSYQHYQNERYLSDEEKLAMNQWIKARVPPGDLNNAPEPPIFENAPKITGPDFSSIIPAYTVPADLSGDLYRCFVLSNPFPEKIFVSAVEIIPGNTSIVHHVNVFQDTSRIPIDLDAADPLPGYTMFGGIGTETAQLISSWVPGASYAKLPEKMAFAINPGSRIVIQIHYPVYAAGQVDSTRVNFKYITGTGIRTVEVNHLLNAKNALVNGPLVIPANKVKKFYERLVLPGNVPLSILGIAPHAHLICASMKAYAVTPVGDTVPLINIKKWDFHWQGAYMFKQMITLPGGSTLYGEAVYDNTTNNPNNPNNPPKLVKRGEGTTDEMMEFYFLYTKYKKGDEQIVFDTTTQLPTYNNCSFVLMPGPKQAIAAGLNENLKINSKEQAAVLYPNPAKDHIQLVLNDAAPSKVTVYNMTGLRVYETTAIPGNNRYNVQHLTKGYYYMTISNRNIQTTLRFLKE